MSSEDISELILTKIDDQVTPEPDGAQDATGNIWSSVRYLQSQAKKSTTPFSEDDVDEALETLRSEGRIIEWVGLVAPATETHLRAIIENEAQCKFSRQILIGRCNELMGVDQNQQEDAADAQ